MHSAFMRMESKFHNDIFQFRESSSLQASNRMLVSSCAGKSQVKNNLVFLIVKPSAPACQTTNAGLNSKERFTTDVLQVHAEESGFRFAPIGGLGVRSVIMLTWRTEPTRVESSKLHESN